MRLRELSLDPLTAQTSRILHDAFETVRDKILLIANRKRYTGNGLSCGTKIGDL